ncbi:MAG: PKD domain-containing protein [Chitinophagales bacterium]
MRYFISIPLIFIFAISTQIIFCFGHIEYEQKEINNQNQNTEQIDYEYSVSGLTVTYSTNLTNDSLVIVWDLGDVTITDQHSVEHTYQAMGYYETCMRKINPKTKETIVKKCKYVEIPDANICEATWRPVCGCDNQTYLNACFAENYHGIYYWTEGACRETDYNLVSEFLYTISDLTVQFINTSVGNYDDISWEMGDKTSTKRRNPKHTYGKEGVYQVCLTVKSDITTKKEQFCEEIELITKAEVEVLETNP